MYPLLNEKPLWKDPKGDVALNLTHCSKEYIFKLVEDFQGRYYVENWNGFLILYIQNVIYDEFARLVVGYSHGLECGYFHLIIDPEYPRCKYLLTAKEN
jgi:hypothetical protein